MKLLIDCDYIVYKCCAATETEIDFGEDLIIVTSNYSEAYKRVKREIQQVQDEFMCDDVILFFTSPINFRKKILPEYKGHRQRKKPCGFKRVINNLKIEALVVLIYHVSILKHMNNLTPSVDGKRSETSLLKKLVI